MMSARDRLAHFHRHLRHQDLQDKAERAGLHVTRTGSSNSRRLWTLDEIKAKNKDGAIILVIHNKVYDVTEFAEEHPGGSELLTDIDVEDLEAVNAEFDDAEHSEDAFEDMEGMLVGRLVPEERLILSSDEDTDDSEVEEEDDEDVFESEHSVHDPLTTFSQREDLVLPLKEKKFLSHDVCLFQFALPSSEHYFGLPVGTHVILSFEQNNGAGTLTRPYTPCSRVGDQGVVDILVKLYPNGKMSKHLSSLNVGQSIRMRGPRGKFEYLGDGNFQVRRDRRSVNEIGMICGGSGITPMFQVLQSIAESNSDNTKVTLLFANKSEKDIILRRELERLQSLKPKLITLHYTLDRPPSQWTGLSGFVTKEMIASTMPPPTSQCVILLCGPTPMIKKGCIPNLQLLGYSRTQYFAF